MLQTTALSQVGGYIDGAWVVASAGPTFDVMDPATGEVLARVPELGAREAVEAIDAGARSMEREEPPEERRGWLLSIARGLLDRRAELARIITLEQGKPLRESAAEVEYCAGFFDFFASQLGLLAPRRVEVKRPGASWTVHHRPAGVAGLITPWNFPLAMLGKKVAAALAAGCAVVQKPAKLTPLSAMAFFAAAEDVGIPRGRLNLVVGDTVSIGEAFSTHPAVRVISFTGSTEAGKLLSARTAPYLKRLAMELGGNAPFIVFEDADLEAAADALVANKFRAGGQTCVCTNRVYVQASVERAFLEAVVPRTARLRVGDGSDPRTDVGPLINRAAFDKVSAHVSDAIEKGATRVVGGDPPRPENDWGAWYPPTVLSGVRPEMLVCREETFGPVIAVGRFEEESEVVAEANSTPYGLAAYVFTRDRARAERVVARLRFGHVGLNTGAGPTPEAPFGGMKDSGFGREGGVEGLLEYVETQVVARG